jgi:hypothetical protein
MSVRTAHGACPFFEPPSSRKHLRGLPTLIVPCNQTTGTARAGLLSNRKWAGYSPYLPFRLLFWRL